MVLKFSAKAKTRLKKLGVGIVYLIGSRAIGTARPNSDFDFAVVMVNPGSAHKNNLDLYYALHEIFSAALPKIKIDLPYPDNMIDLDIVFLQTAPLYYARSAVESSVVLFETSSVCRADFAEKTMREYADMEPFLRTHYQAVLQNI